jgi:hypothetical protein
MSFNDLAPELLAMVVTHLRRPNSRLSAYATLSRGFGAAIEAITFSELRLTSEEFDDFERIVRPQSPGRRDILGSVDFHAVLPTYTDVQCALFERETDKHLNNEAFTRSITRLLSTLSYCREGSTARPINLRINYSFSPKDISHRETGAQDRRDVENRKRQDLFEDRYKYSYLNFLQQESTILPVVPRVTNLRIDGQIYRLIAPAAAGILASSLPKLDAAEWMFGDDNSRYPELRVKLRNDFAQSLNGLRSPCMTDFKLDYRTRSPNNEGFRNANCLRDDGVDPLSLQLGLYLQTCNLVWVHLSGPICLGPEFFWSGGDGEQTGLASAWPALKTFELELSPVRPDGGYYFQRDPRARREYEDPEDLPDIDDVLSDSSDDNASFNGSEESFFERDETVPDVHDHVTEETRSGDLPDRLFRALPTSELEEFLEAAARCAVHMPHVERFSAVFDVPAPRKQFGFEFVTCGFENYTGVASDDIHRNRLIWTVPRDWRANHTIGTIWNGIIGENGVVKYEEWFVDRY